MGTFSRSALSAAVTAVVAAVLLCGCVPAAPAPVPTKTAAFTPMFATDADALAAATAAYGAYQKVSDDIFMQGGENPGRMTNVSSGRQLATDLAAFSDARKQHLRSTGGSTFGSVVLEQYSRSAAPGSMAVAVYLCEDISKVDVLNQLGQSIVSADRPARVLYEVQLERGISEINGLFVSDKQRLAGKPC